MPSFDITSEFDAQEIDNAVNQAAREISTRFDFRGGKSEISFDRAGKVIKIIADDELKLRSIHQILEGKLAKREVDCRFLDYGDEEQISGGALSQKVTLSCGIQKDQAKTIIKKIKDLKLKVQPQIQDELIRVTGKKIDELQEVIACLKSADLPMPLQYVNMRS